MEGVGVDRTRPASCPMADFHFRDAETLVCSCRDLVLRYVVES
jgi:hypothetical protein